MAENFYICINAVLPLFLLIAVGAVVRTTGLLSGDDVKKVNKFVFAVFFPPMMFSSLYRSHLVGEVSYGYLIYGVLLVTATMLLSVPIVKKIEDDPAQQGVMIQDSFRSNFVIMGLPIVMNLFGTENLGLTTLMISVVVPVFNIFAVVIFEIKRGGEVNMPRILKGVAKNPIIIGTVVGAIFLFLDIKLPQPVEDVVFSMGDACSSIALIVLGASFRMGGVASKKRNLILIILTRLVIVPFITLVISAVVGFRGVEFVTLLVMLAAPPSVSSYTMADAMGSDGDLAAGAVIFGSAFSCITLFLWLFLFRTIGMF